MGLQREVRAADAEPHPANRDQRARAPVLLLESTRPRRAEPGHDVRRRNPQRRPQQLDDQPNIVLGRRRRDGRDRREERAVRRRPRGAPELEAAVERGLQPREHEREAAQDGHARAQPRDRRAERVRLIIVQHVRQRVRSKGPRAAEERPGEDEGRERGAAAAVTETLNKELEAAQAMRKQVQDSERRAASADV